MTNQRRERQRANLKRMLKPRHIAFIGGRHLERCIAMCRDSGFSGEIIAINPRYETLAGIACTPSLDALDVAPDAAFIALSRDGSIDMVTSLAQMGAGGAVCHAAGFGELGGEFSVAQENLAKAAGDMAVIGPNCMGVINAFDGVALWGEYNPLSPVDGSGVALISQSGAFLYGIISVEQAYPMGYGISVGNQAVIDSADLIDFVLDDERVRVIGLYVEGLTNGAALSEALGKALDRRIPVVLLRGGGTPASAERSLSHTGNLAVPNDFWRALIERYALIDVASPKQLVETTKLVAVSGVPAGNRAFFVTNSGAAATLLAEQARDRGLALPPIPAEVEAAIKPTLPDVVTVSNPLDFNLPWRADAAVSMDNADSMTTCLQDISRDRTDILTFILDVPRRETGGDTPWHPTIDALIALRRRVGFPVVTASLLPEGLEPHLRGKLLAGGVAPLCGFTETLDAMAQAAAYGARLDQIEAPPEPPLQGTAPATTPRALDEWAGKRALAEHGLRAPKGWAGPAGQAGEAAAKIGFPVVLKVLSETLAHKSKLGGVKLGLHSIDDVETAVNTMRQDLERSAPDHVLEHVLIEAMVDDVAAELLIGVKRHAALGLALVIGRGGVDVEQIRDYALALIPASDREMTAVLDRLSIPLECTARANLVATIRAIERFAMANAERLAELDVNPVMVRRDGSTVAADALVVLAG
ncbi:MAG: acetate--CoA ligase family protein [Pseudomonadota bacterium]